MMNLLASLTGASYENTARGILYVIYEVIWKLMYYVLTLIDEISKLFYKVAGINVNDGVVENKNIFDQLLNQQIISTWYLVFVAIAAGLVFVFSLAAIIKLVASNDEKKSVGPILKNIGLALILLIVLGPIILVIISFISNLAIIVASVGGNSSISVADIIFGNSGNLLDVYNQTFDKSFTSFRELGNGFLYELIYNPSSKDGVQTLSFHWYIVLVGGGFVLYNLTLIVIDIVKRIFNIIILYLGSPFVISKMALDDGKSFKEWQAKFFQEFILLLTQITTFMIFSALVNVLNNINFDSFTSSEAPSIEDGGLLEPVDPGASVPVEEPEVFSLLNGLGRTLIIMAAISITRSSASMLTTLLSAKDSKTDSLLENVLNKLSSRGTPTTRTRTITKNTTTTKRETVFLQDVPSSRGFNSDRGGNDNKVTNNHNTFNQNVSVNNKFSSTNNITNRTSREGIKSGSYEQKVSPSNVYINATRSVEPTGDSSFKFMDSATTKAASNIVKEYTKANTNLTSAINSGDNGKIKESLNEYTKAYSKEASILSDNYRKFETRANATMKSEVSSQTKQELKNISNAYRKAQMDYSRTANKLKEYDGERISTADALKMKERADKQRERLMSASNKAAQFYENQKKGE